MRRDLVASWRLMRGAAHVLRGWWTVRVRFPGWSEAQREHAVQAQSLRSQGKNTPFEGYELPGRVRMTVVGGHIAFEAN